MKKTKFFSQHLFYFTYFLQTRLNNWSDKLFPVCPMLMYIYDATTSIITHFSLFLLSVYDSEACCIIVLSVYQRLEDAQRAQELNTSGQVKLLNLLNTVVKKNTLAKVDNKTNESLKRLL